MIEEIEKRMEGAKERPSFTGMFFFKEKPATQSLAPSNESLRHSTKMQVEERASSATQIAEREQGSKTRNETHSSSLPASTSDSTIETYATRAETSSSFHLEPQEYAQQSQAERMATETSEGVAENKPARLSATLGAQASVALDKVSVSGPQRLLDLLKRPRKRSFDLSSDMSQKRQKMNERESSTQVDVNDKWRNEDTLVKRTANMNKRPAANLIASEGISPVLSRHREANVSHPNNASPASETSGDVFIRSFKPSRNMSSERRSKRRFSGETPEYLSDPAEVASSTHRMASRLPTSVTQTPGASNLGRNPSLGTTVLQDVRPINPPTGDAALIHDQDLILANFTDRQESLASLGNKSSGFSASNLWGTLPTTATYETSSTLQLHELSANKALYQRAHHAGHRSARSQPEPPLVRNQQSTNGAVNSMKRLRIQELPPISHVQNTTEFKPSYGSPYTYPYRTAGAYTTSAQMQGQQTHNIANVAPKYLDKSLHNSKAISASSQSHSKNLHGHQHFSQKEKHSEIIDLTQDETQLQKKPQTTIPGSYNRKGFITSWDNDRMKGVQQEMVAPLARRMTKGPKTPRSGAPMHHRPQPPSMLPQQPTPQFRSTSHTHPSYTSLYYPTVNTASTSGVILPDHFLHYNDIVKPLVNSSASNAPYGRGNIARSILVATNSHPTLQGLNFHLRRLRRYEAVDESSNLLTFRWDLVDPTPVSNGQKTIKEQQFVGMPPIWPQNGYQQLPIHGSQPMPKKYPLNANATPGQLGEFRQASKSKAPPIIGSATPFRPVGESRISHFGVGLEPTSEVPAPVPAPVPPSNQMLMATTSQTEPSSILKASFNDTLRSPPASLSRIAVEIRSPAVFSDATSATPKKRGRPIKDPAATLPIQSVPKKRGRPFRDPEVAAALPVKKAQVTSNPPKKRGRPFKSLQEMADIPLREPKFLVFKCEWSGCSAELHSLEVLRLHLVTIHGKKQKSGDLTCVWGNCHKSSKVKSSKLQAISIETVEKSTNSTSRGIPREEVIKIPKDYYQTLKDVRGPLDTREVSSETTKTSKSVEYTIQRLSFKKKQEWEAHIEKAHLVPYAWHMGDGPIATLLPRSTEIDKKKINPWLYDKNGNQMIDSVEGQQIEDGQPAKNNDKRFTRVRQGIHIILQPVKNPEAYKVYDYSDDEMI